MGTFSQVSAKTVFRISIFYAKHKYNSLEKTNFWAIIRIPKGLAGWQLRDLARSELFLGGFVLTVTFRKKAGLR